MSDDRIQWSDEEGPRAFNDWACDGGTGEWHWHPAFVHDHKEAEERISLGLFGPDDVRPAEVPAVILDSDERLTVLATVLRTALVTDGGDLTLWDRLDSLGVPMDDLLGDALPLSSPPYSPETLDRLMTARRVEPASLPRGTYVVGTHDSAPR